MIVCLGGGSTLDASKAAELLRTLGGEIDDYFGVGRVAAKLEATGLTPSKLLIIVSSRTQKWLEQDGVADIFLPSYGGVNQKFLTNFHDTKYFKLIRNVDNEIYVFEVNS